jgi:hypothetical protein
MSNKNLLKLMSIVLVAMLSFGFVSCGDDDNDSQEAKVKKQLVGVWYTSIRYNHWTYIELEPNGTLHFGLWLNDTKDKIFYSSQEYRNNAHWVYNETDQTISMYADYGDENAYSFKVNMSADGNSWAGYTDGQSNTVSFKRINLKPEIPSSN